MDELSERAEGLTFPCEFPIKAMGPDNGVLVDAVWRIVTRHAPHTPADAVRTSHSRHGRFISVTITITAEDRPQLDAIYADLKAHDGVLATL